jgi:dihydroorotate dehydrogenase electron transfer subunit
MLNKKFPITAVSILNPSISKIRFLAPEIASTALPGQFVNIKIDETTTPLLRRPFSVHFIEEDEVEIVFGIMGMGTNKLNSKKVGDYLDVIGPLGKPFSYKDTEEISILIGGGLGAAPLSLLSKYLEKKGKEVITFLGARTKAFLISDNLKKINYATDDGTFGYHGNVVSLLKSSINKFQSKKIKVYGCGPTAMLKALIEMVDKLNIPCEVSLETAMACGVGICQGCAVEMKSGDKKYSLACKDGPVFSISQIKLWT